MSEVGNFLSRGYLPTEQVEELGKNCDDVLPLPPSPEFFEKALQQNQKDDNKVSEDTVKVPAKVQMTGWLLKKKFIPALWMARASLDRAAQKVFWLYRYFEVGTDSLVYWTSLDLFKAGHQPTGSYSLKDVDDVAVHHREIYIHFTAVQRTGNRRRKRVTLCLCTMSSSDAEEWAEVLRNAAGKCIKQNADDLPENWDVSAMLNQQSSAVRLVAKVALPEKTVLPVQRLVDHAFVCKSTKDRRGRELPLKLDVVEVFGVQNATSWVEYTKARSDIKTLLDGKFRQNIQPQVCTLSIEDPLVHEFLGEIDKDANELWLFHGTSPQAVHGIADNEFRIDLAGSHRGTMYGKGVYFAECSSKADEYAEEGEDGLCRMLICRVTLGKILINTEKKPDVEELMSEARAGWYNSVLGDRWTAVNTFREFIVYDSAQVYPAYIIHYRRKMQTALLTEVRIGVESCDEEHGLKLIPYIARVADTHPNPAVKLAVYVLFDAHAAVVVPALVSFLKDDKKEVRHYAHKALKELTMRIGMAPVKLGEHPEKAIPPLLNCLGEDMVEEARQAAARALGQLGKFVTAEAVTKLIACLEDVTVELRLAATASLGQIGAPAVPAMPAIIKCLKDPRDEMRKVAVHTLSHFSPEVAGGHPEYGAHAAAAVDALASCLSDAPDEERKGAAATLGEFGTHAQTAHVVNAMADCLVKDNCEETRKAAAKSLTKLGMVSSPVAPQLMECLLNQHEQIREGAAKVLGQLGGHALLAVPALTDIVTKDRHEAPRIAAITALGHLGYGATSAVPALTDCLKDQSDRIRGACATAVGQLGKHSDHPAGKDLAEQLLHSTQDQKTQNLGMRESSCLALGNLRGALGPHGPTALQLLKNILSLDPEDRMKIASANAIGHLSLTKHLDPKVDIGSAAPVLAEAMKVNRQLREPCAKALGRLGKNAATHSLVLPGLVDCLKDSRKVVRVEAAKAFARVGAHVTGAALLLIECAAQMVDSGRNSMNSSQVAESRRLSGKGKGRKYDARPDGCIEQATTATARETRGAISSALQQLDASSAAVAVKPLAELLRDRKTSAASRSSLMSMFKHIATHDLPTAVPVLIDCSKEPNELLRQKSLEAMRMIGKEHKGDLDADQAVSVMTVLGDILGQDASTYESDEVRQAAASALAEYKSWATPMVPELITCLKDKNNRLRETAATALGTLKEHAKEAIPHIVKMLKHTKPYIRKAASEALGKYGVHAASAVPSIMELAADKTHPETRAAAVAALGKLHKHAPDAVFVISEALKDRDVEARMSAAKALAKFGAKAGSEALKLLECLQDDNEDVRFAAGRALSKVAQQQDDTAVPVLIEFMASPYETTREAAAVAIGEFFDTSTSSFRSAAVQPLAECLRATSGKVRAAAVTAVGQVCKEQDIASTDMGSRVVAGLTECLQDKNKLIRLSACESLRDMCTSTFPSAALVNCFKDESDRVRNIAVDALVKIGLRTASEKHLLGDMKKNIRGSIRGGKTGKEPQKSGRHSSKEGPKTSPKAKRPPERGDSVEVVGIKSRANSGDSGQKGEHLDLDDSDSGDEVGARGEDSDSDHERGGGGGDSDSDRSVQSR